MNPDFFQKLTTIIEANLSDENFGPEQLAEILGISHSTLHRRIKKTTGKTISQFIRDVRLEKASELLLSEESTISEIAYDVGFGSVTYFNRCFHERFNCSPGEYKKLKQERLDTGETKKKKTKNRILILAASTILVLILVFNLYNKLQFLASNNPKEKSVAVMPFTFSGENHDKDYMCRSLEDNIKSGLSKIGNLIIVNVFPTENDSRIKIGKHVDYFLDGTVHQQGNNFTLLLKLTNAKNNRLEWSESYDLTNRVISIDSDVAQTVAQKLHATVSEHERSLIEKKPTINPDAFDLYQRGQAIHMEYWLDNGNLEALQKAEDYYQKALKLDSTFALAYAGMARIAYDKTRWSDIFNKDYLDTVIILANKALFFNNSLSDAYTLIGDCYSEKAPDKAKEFYQKALAFNPNDWQAYYGLAIFNLLENNIKSVEYLLEAAKRNKGNEYSLMLGTLAFDLSINGLFAEAQDFNQRKLEWDGDSIFYFARLAGIERYEGHYDKAIEYGLKAYKLDSSNIEVTGALLFFYTLNNDYRNALKYLNKTKLLLSVINFKRNNEHHRTGYVYLMNEDTLRAKMHFEIQIEACNELINSSQNLSAIYDLAATYSITGQKEKAYEMLNKFAKNKEISWFFYVMLKDDPLFQNLRNDAEYQQILKVVYEKATATRDNLKTWFHQQKIS